MLLHSLGCFDGIADSLVEYVDKGVVMVSNYEYLKKSRKILRSQMVNSSLCNAKRFVQDVENAYKTMWKEKTFESLI